tara:strand:- start:212 stop:328 length:117 start_codon:yes stop_codon:yes gene_type:complete
MNSVGEIPNIRAKINLINTITGITLTISSILPVKLLFI